MNLLMKWTLIFATLMIVINSSHAFTIGSKQQPAILVHTSYFITPNNSPVSVYAIAHVGNTDSNGNCNYSTANIYLGTNIIKTGDFIYYDGQKLQSIIGTPVSDSQTTCMTIFYYLHQIVNESFTLIFTGGSYQSSSPSSANITIL